MPDKKRGPGRPKGSKTSQATTQKQQAPPLHHDTTPPCTPVASTACLGTTHTTVPMIIDDDDSEPDVQQAPRQLIDPLQQQTNDVQNEQEQQVQEHGLLDAERDDIVSLSPEY
eukprot:6478288-Amphidinium_carterae.1